MVNMVVDIAHPPRMTELRRPPREVMRGVR